MSQCLDSRHDPDEEHAAAAERDMRVLERAARLHMAGLDVTAHALKATHGQYHKHYIADSIARLIDRGDLERAYTSSVSWAVRYRVTPRGFARVGAVPLWVAA